MVRAMKKTNLLAEATTPDGEALTLHEHDGTYSIRIAGQELMSTRRFASEEKLAELACAHVRTAKGARVLIGGLGFGFTARAALANLGPDASVTIAELLPPVIAWNENPDYPLAKDVLADKRVRVVQRDVYKVINEVRPGFDAIMLDVDNGPQAMTDESNARLYEEVGLAQARAALRKGGCLGIWSAAEDPRFAKRLSKAGFQVTVERARAHATSGGWHTLFLARN